MQQISLDLSHFYDKTYGIEDIVPCFRHDNMTPKTTASFKGLTDKALRFCEEYLVDCNATQAAIRAGYAVRSARQIGAENLTKHDISEKIHELMSDRSKTTGVTAQRVVEELAHIAFSRITDLMILENGVLKVRDIRELTDGQKAAIARIKPIYHWGAVGRGDGEEKTEGHVEILGYDIHLYDKLTALLALLRHTSGLDDEEGLAEAAIPLIQLITNGLKKQRAKASKGSNRR